MCDTAEQNQQYIPAKYSVVSLQAIYSIGICSESYLSARSNACLGEHPVFSF